MSTEPSTPNESDPSIAVDSLVIPLVAQHVRFTVRAVTPIAFHEFKCSALRGAFATVLRRTFCPQSQRDPESDQVDWVGNVGRPITIQQSGY